MNPYTLIWYDEAKKEYKKLDGNQRIQVDKGLERIRRRGINSGKSLAKKKYNLSNCYEIKMKRLGLRIVFKEKKNKIEIVEIIAVRKRSDNEVFEETAKRLGLK